MKLNIFESLKAIGNSKNANDGEARESTKGFEKARGFFASPYNLNITVGNIKFSSDKLDMIRFDM